jgi:hypothetical protein
VKAAAAAALALRLMPGQLVPELDYMVLAEFVVAA